MYCRRFGDVGFCPRPLAGFIIVSVFVHEINR
jgi:hypothetical protein